MQVSPEKMIETPVSLAKKEIRQSIIKALYPTGTAIQQNLKAIAHIYPKLPLVFNAAVYEDEDEAGNIVYRFGYCYADDQKYWSTEVEDTTGKSDYTKIIEMIESDKDFWVGAKEVDKDIYISTIKEKMEFLCNAAAKLQQATLSQKPTFNISATKIEVDVNVDI